MTENWQRIYDWLLDELEPTGVALTPAQLRVVAVLIQKRDEKLEAERERQPQR